MSFEYFLSNYSYLFGVYIFLIGCLITFGQEYNSKKNVNYLWESIKHDYDCAYLKIDGIFDGCILNYINANFCHPK